MLHLQQPWVSWGPLVAQDSALGDGCGGKRHLLLWLVAVTPCDIKLGRGGSNDHTTRSLAEKRTAIELYVNGSALNWLRVLLALEWAGGHVLDAVHTYTLVQRVVVTGAVLLKKC